MAGIQKNLLTSITKSAPAVLLNSNNKNNSGEDKALLLKEYELCYIQYARMYLDKSYSIDADLLNRCSEILELALVNNSVDKEMVAKVKEVIQKAYIKGLELFCVFTGVQGALIHIVAMIHPEYSVDEINMVIDKAYAELIYKK